MGRTFVTFEEAAQLLKCTVRTVHNFVKRGQLRKEFELGSVALSRDEVEQLARERGIGLPPLNNHTLMQMMGRITNLEVQLSVFKKMHGITDRKWLRPTDQEASSLMGMIQFFLTKKDFTNQEVDLCASIFGRLDELSFDLLKKATGRDDFWKDFFTLCLNLLDFVSDHDRSPNLRERARLDLELSLGLKGMRAVILTWIELGHGTTTTQLSKNLGTKKDDLIRRLSLS